jgi:hypothetical protein
MPDPAISATRVPFTPLEESFVRMERAAVGSFRVMIVLRLEGVIEEQPLAAALRDVQRRHPKLRAAIAPTADGHHAYDGACDTPPIPYAIEDVEGTDRPWTSAANRLMQIRFPDEGPWAMLHVLRNRAQQRSDMILAMHHAIGDGLSGLGLYDDLLAAYARAVQGEASPQSGVLPLVNDVRAIQRTRWRDLAWLVRRIARMQRRERALTPAPLPERGASDTDAQWCHWTFSAGETQHLCDAAVANGPRLVAFSSRPSPAASLKHSDNRVR